MSKFKELLNGIRNPKAKVKFDKTNLLVGVVIREVKILLSEAEKYPNNKVAKDIKDQWEKTMIKLFDNLKKAFDSPQFVKVRKEMDEIKKNTHEIENDLFLKMDVEKFKKKYPKLTPSCDLLKYKGFFPIEYPAQYFRHKKLINSDDRVEEFNRGFVQLIGKEKARNLTIQTIFSFKDKIEADKKTPFLIKAKHAAILGVSHNYFSKKGFRLKDLWDNSQKENSGKKARFQYSQLFQISVIRDQFPNEEKLRKHYETNYLKRTMDIKPFYMKQDTAKY